MVAPRYLTNSYDIGHLVLWITALLVHPRQAFSHKDTLKSSLFCAASCLITLLICIPAGWTRKPCTEGADLPLQQHRLLLPSLQSRSLAGESDARTHTYTCTCSLCDLWPRFSAASCHTPVIYNLSFRTWLLHPRTNQPIMKCISAGEKSDITDLFTADCVNVSLGDNANVECVCVHVCVCVCVCARLPVVTTDAAASAPPGERCAPRAPGTPRRPQLDHAGSRGPEADRRQLAGVHAQPHRGRPAGHVQVLHVGGCQP